GVLLEVVADAGDVGRDLDLGGELHASDLAQRGVRLLRGGGVHARAHTAPLRGALEGGSLELPHLRGPPLADELLDRRHYVSVSSRATGAIPDGGRAGCWSRSHEAPAARDTLQQPPTTGPMVRRPAAGAARGLDREPEGPGSHFGPSGDRHAEVGAIARGHRPARDITEGPTARARFTRLPATRQGVKGAGRDARRSPRPASSSRRRSVVVPQEGRRRVPAGPRTRGADGRRAPVARRQR